jgi:asparagine synthase (glutamine-hydrolysing)
MRVMLDGQGADEVLGGYANYVPVAAASLLEQGRVGAYARTSMQYRRRFGSFPHQIGAVARSLARAPFRGSATRHSGPLNEFLAAETESSTLPSLLRYEDRNSMAHSIEARVPFLDHRLVELAFSLPCDWKIRGVTTKRILREAVADLIPQSVSERTDKLGFRADPAMTWSIVEGHRDGLIANRTELEEKWFDPTAVRGLFDAADRSTESEFLVWRVLSLKSWLRATWGDSDRPLFA